MQAVLLLLVPLRAHELDLSVGDIGLLVAAGSLLPALASTQLGAIVDRLGGRACFLGATGISVVLAAGFVVVDAFAALLVLQLFLGLARTMGWVASQAYLTTTLPRAARQTAASRFGFFANGAAMVGPLGAGLLADVVGVRLTFWGVAGFALVFWCAALSLPAGRRTARAGVVQPPLPARVRQLVVSPGVRFSLGLTFVALWISVVWSAFFPLLWSRTARRPRWRALRWRCEGRWPPARRWPRGHSAGGGTSGA